MSKMYDAAIIGAGPAGVSTALFLIHQRPELAGRIIVLEKATFPHDKFCAGAIGARADASPRRGAAPACHSRALAACAWQSMCVEP